MKIVNELVNVETNREIDGEIDGETEGETDEYIDRETYADKYEKNKQLEGKNVYVIFIVKKGWLPYFFQDCEEWINITYPINTPFILGVYFNQKCADRMLEILDRSLSTDSKKIVDFYSHEMSESEFLDIYNSKKDFFLKITKYNYLANLIYDHIYCNGTWINAYELTNRIERKNKRKRISSNSDHSNNHNPNHHPNHDYLYSFNQDDYTSLID
jgi:hypothetical protein